jgi:hypothetical protein
MYRQAYNNTIAANIPNISPNVLYSLSIFGYPKRYSKISNRYNNIVKASILEYI